MNRNTIIIVNDQYIPAIPFIGVINFILRKCNKKLLNNTFRQQLNEFHSSEYYKHIFDTINIAHQASIDEYLSKFEKDELPMLVHLKTGEWYPQIGFFIVGFLKFLGLSDNDLQKFDIRTERILETDKDMEKDLIDYPPNDDIQYVIFTSDEPRTIFLIYHVLKNI